MNLKDLANKLQVMALDSLAKKSAYGKIYRKQKLIKGLAKLFMLLPFCRAKYAQQTIMEHLDLNETEAKALVKDFFETFLSNALEMAGLRFLPADQLLERVQCQGLEHLDAALSLGKGAIIVSGHFGTWEFMPHWLSLRGYPVTTVVRRQNNQLVDAWFEAMRQVHGGKTTDSGFGMRPILRALKRGEILALMVDQDNGKAGIFVKFFNKWASAPTGPAVIGLRTGAPIVPLTIFPNKKGKHEFKIEKPLYMQDYEDNLKGQLELTRAYTAILEEQIRRLPRHWFWVHRRWKTQPEDALHNAWVQELVKLGEIEGFGARLENND